LPIFTKFVYVIDMRGYVSSQNPNVELELPFLVKITAAPVLVDAK